MFQQFSGMEKKFMDKRWGGGITFFLPSKFFCFTLPKKFEGEPSNVSDNFRYRKVLNIKRRYHNFALNFFCLTEPKKFVGDPFYVSKTFWHQKFSCIGGGGALRFFRKFFVSECRKDSWGNPSMFQKMSGIEEFYA